MSNDAPTAEGRVKVGNLVAERMDELELRVADVVRISGLKEPTINGVIDATGKATKSTLVALAAVLNWNHQYLYDTVCGKTADSKSPMEASLAELVAKVALKSDLAGISDAVHAINGKSDTIIRRLGLIEDDPSPG